MRNPTNLLTVFTLFCIVMLLQGCSRYALMMTSDLAIDEGSEHFLSKARQCVAATQVTAYRKFPVVNKRVYVFEESIKHDLIQEPYEYTKRDCEVKTDPFLGVVPYKTCDSKTIRVGRKYMVYPIMQCVAKNVDLNHNKRLLEVQRCLENSCMQSFEVENWWPSDRPMNSEHLPKTGSWAIRKLAECIGCPYSQAELLAEGGHDPDFVARKLEAFNSSPVSYNFGPSSIHKRVTSHTKVDGSMSFRYIREGFRLSSPFQREDPKTFIPNLPGWKTFRSATISNVEEVDQAYGMIPFHLFNSVEAGSLTRIKPTLTPTFISPLREIIFCDPIIPSKSFYLVDSPVLVDDLD